MDTMNIHDLDAWCTSLLVASRDAVDADLPPVDPAEARSISKRASRSRRRSV